MVLCQLTRVAAGAVVAATTLTVVGASTVEHPEPRADLESAAGGPREERLRGAYVATPLSFEANRGQSDAEVEYLAQGRGFTLFLTREGAVFDLPVPARKPAGPEARAVNPVPARGVAVALDLIGADRTPRMEARFRQEGTSTYFGGEDLHRLTAGVPNFSELGYLDIYPGIDLEFRGDRSGPEYGFVVAAGADPAAIGYRLRGAESMRLDRSGHLVAATAAGDFVHHAPLAYQRIHGKRRPVHASFHLVDGLVSFDVGSYDPTRPLVIAPDTDLPYSSYLGGTGYDSGMDTAMDTNGDLYVTGYAGTDFPTTTGAYDRTTGGPVDAFVSKFTSDGAGGLDLAYATVLGGSDDDWGKAIAVDQGDVYLTGSTYSQDFPTTTGAYDTSFNGDRLTDTFVARISPDGAGSADLEYSTLLGGTGFDMGHGIALDGGDVSVFGYTESGTFPTTAGAFDTSFGGLSDVFFATISPDGSQEGDLVYSTFVGGADIDGASAMALSGGDAFLTGITWGTDFPTTTGAFDTTASDTAVHPDAYVARISPDGAGAADLVYSTYLGGSKGDYTAAVVASGGDVYLTGYTNSSGFPTVAGAYDRTLSGEYDVFVARMSPDGNGRPDLLYSTFLGARREDFPNSLFVDGDVYVIGASESPGFPTTRGAYDRSYGGELDAFVARIRTGTRAAGLVHSTFLGGGAWDDGRDIVVVDGTAYITGETASEDFPTTAGADDGTFNGGFDAFLSLIRLPDNRYRPDGWIRFARGRNHGDGVYNTTAREQTRSARARRGERKVFWVTAQNDSRLADRLALTGPGSTKRWRVRYHRAGSDITRQVVGGGYATRLLGTGDRVLVRVAITPKTVAPIGSTKSVRVVLTSRGESARQDVVRARVTVER